MVQTSKRKAGRLASRVLSSLGSCALGAASQPANKAAYPANAIGQTFPSNAHTACRSGRLRVLQASVCVCVLRLLISPAVCVCVERGAHKHTHGKPIGQPTGRANLSVIIIRVLSMHKRDDAILLLFPLPYNLLY